MILKHTYSNSKEYFDAKQGAIDYENQLENIRLMKEKNSQNQRNIAEKRGYDALYSDNLGRESNKA
jgi:hypothetical protein